MVLSSINPIQIRNSKPKLILVIYYGILEQFIGVKESLELFYDVIHFPYFHYLQNFGHEIMMSKLKELLDEKPEYILWWILFLDSNSLREIVNYDHNVKHLYFNWDEPFNFESIDAKSKAKFLNHAFGTCTESMQRYLNYGSLKANCLYSGYSPRTHYPYFVVKKDNEIRYDFSKIKYRHDISFAFTNLYEDSEKFPQIINRKNLVDNLYLNQKSNYNFAIYGPENLKDKYPDSYECFIKFDDQNKMFNESRINICTHCISTWNGYLNERVFLIMASGGLLLVDPIKGVDSILKNGYNCIFINPTKVVSQIKKIISNPDYYNRIRINAWKTSLNYTWDDWSMRMREMMNK